jgi:hypothetical protein
MFQCRCNQDLFISCNAVVPPRSPSQLQPPSPAPACSDGGPITHPGSSTTLEAYHACAGRSWTASQCVARRPQHCNPWHKRHCCGRPRPAPAPGMAGLRSGIRIRSRIGDGAGRSGIIIRAGARCSRNRRTGANGERHARPSSQMRTHLK